MDRYARKDGKKMLKDDFDFLKNACFLMENVL